MIKYNAIQTEKTDTTDTLECVIKNIDLNSQMVINGWAIAYKYYSLDYEKEEETAKSKRIGI